MTFQVDSDIRIQRNIGTYTGTEPGPTLICVGGMHGNEHAAVIALNHICRLLEERRPRFRGKFAAISGNVGALKENVRYKHQDLNRIWLPGNMQRLKNGFDASADATSEMREQAEIFSALQPLLAERTHPVFVLDLHTTSAQSHPFTIIHDKPANRQFALNFHAPIILGLLDHLKGSLIQYLEDAENCLTVAFEAGQHDDEVSIHRHIAAVWIAMVSAGCIDEKDVPDPDYEDYQSYLRETLRDIPKVFRVHYRYAIRAGETFVMTPGFENFHPIESGQTLAHSNGEEIHCHEDGNIFMPLYQPQGDDGYFIIRKIEGY